MNVGGLGAVRTPTAWSCFTRTTDELVKRAYGDVLGHRYDYDSNVMNHKAIAPGDLLVVRDGQLILGHGVVEDVTSGPGVKTMRRSLLTAPAPEPPGGRRR